jgi:Zn-dependent protease
VTLNPLPHIRREPFGMVALPLLSLALSHGTSCFGFAHAPIDPRWAYHNPKKAALMSAAGPLSNLLLAAIAFAVLYSIGRPDGNTAEAIHRIAAVFLLLNLLLAVFNVIPVPPLDGAGVVTGLFPPARRFYDTIQRIPYSGIIILIVLIQVLPDLYLPVYRTVAHWLPYPPSFR